MEIWWPLHWVSSHDLPKVLWYIIMRTKVGPIHWVRSRGASGMEAWWKEAQVAQLKTSGSLSASSQWALVLEAFVHSDFAHVNEVVLGDKAQFC